MEEKEPLKFKDDWVFKRIFTKDGNEDILADFISSILDTEIKNIELRNTELTKEKEDQKGSVLDIKAELDNKVIADIEMQIECNPEMIDRDLQYLTKLYANQLLKGHKYTDTKKVIVINILGEGLCKRNTYHSIVHLKYEDYDKDTYLKMYDIEDDIFTDKLEIHLIELPKFLKLKNIEEDSKLVQWLQLISGEKELVQMALSKKAQAIKKAYEELEYLSQDEKARQEYEDYLMAKMDEEVKIEHATKVGRKEGEHSKSIEIAKKMLEMKVDINIIIEATGLSKQEIESL